MLGLLLIIMIVYIIYILNKWNEKAEKKLRELERKTFQKMNYRDYELIDYVLNESKTPKLDKYINEIKKHYEKININEEKKYLKKIKDGCQLTLEKFVQKKLYNVIEIVNKLNKNGLHPELINVGNKALIESCETFKGNNNFDIYSKKIITEHILEELKYNNYEYRHKYQEKTFKHKARICLTCQTRRN